AAVPPRTALLSWQDAWSWGRICEARRDRKRAAGWLSYAVTASGLLGDVQPVELPDRFLADATEVDVDAISDGERVVIGGVMEHIEEAGVHSGDSACSIPPYSLGRDVVDEIVEATRKLALELGVRGLMNVQYAVKDKAVYVLEVNPRASRTAPFVSKAIGRPLAKLAALVMGGKTLVELDFAREVWPRHFSVKEAVFPFLKFPGVDTVLGPEMKSTGEVMGIDSDFGRAYAKSQIQAGNPIPDRGRLFVSLRGEDQRRAVGPIREFVDAGFKLLATDGTAKALEEAGLAVDVVAKVGEGSPNVVDRIEAGDVDLVVNTVGAEPRAVRDSFSIRRAALQRGLPYFTTFAALRAAAGAVKALRQGTIGVRSLQEVHRAQ
ncbi:MAG: carbamoyl phosphate synthase large subunit, partial [Myxococcota bacterium]